MKRALFLVLIAAAAASSVMYLMRSNIADAQAPNVPVGSVIAWSGPKSKIPNGWLECDGRELNRTQFQSLFSAIGTTWGGTATDKFKIPDLRGLFLRGVDSSSGRDPDLNQRRPAGNGPIDSAGSVQDDSLKSHAHDIEDPGHSHPFDAFRTDGAGATGQAFPRDPNAMGTGAAKTNISIKVSGGRSETRPKNAYVYFIIRGR